MFQIGGEKNRMGRERTPSVRPLHSGTSDAFQRCLERFPTRGSHTSCPGFHHHCYPEAGLPQRSDVIPPTHTCPQGPTQPRSLLPSGMFLLPLSPNTYCRIRTPCPNPPPAALCHPQLCLPARRCGGAFPASWPFPEQPEFEAERFKSSLRNQIPAIIWKHAHTSLWTLHKGRCIWAGDPWPAPCQVPPTGLLGSVLSDTPWCEATTVS